MLCNQITHLVGLMINRRYLFFMVFVVVLFYDILNRGENSDLMAPPLVASCYNRSVTEGFLYRSTDGLCYCGCLAQ